MATQINKSQIFKRMHELVKTTVLTLSQALKQAWAEAKDAIASIPVMPLACAVVAPVEVEEVFEIECGGKQSRPATYKQYEYLASFANVTIHCNVSAFTSRISVADASEAIDNAKAGIKVIVNR